jgi:hypothetical protein
MIKQGLTMTKEQIDLVAQHKGFVWFAGYKCRVVDCYGGRGTPCPPFVQIRVAQKWWSFPSPPIEYTVYEERWGELSPYVSK